MMSKIKECESCRYNLISHDRYPCVDCLKAFDEKFEPTHFSPSEQLLNGLYSEPGIVKDSELEALHEVAPIVLKKCHIDIYINKYYDSVNHRYGVDA